MRDLNPRGLRLSRLGAMRAGIVIEATLSPATRVSSPSISPASGAVGTVFIITVSAFAGVPTPIITGSLTQAGVDVTGSVVSLGGGQYQFTSTAAGALVWSDSADNTSGLPTSIFTASATVTAAVIPGPEFTSGAWDVSYTGTVSTSAANGATATGVPYGLVATVAGGVLTVTGAPS